MHGPADTAYTPEFLESAETACGGIDEWLAANESLLVGVRRHLHRNPEPSGEERETSRFLVERLGEAGLSARVLRDGLGVVAEGAIGRPGPDALCVAVRADIDALKITDVKTVEYASCNDGVMHACGHDVHSAIVLGLALATAERGGEADGDGGAGVRLRFLFQPAEEICQGAHWLVEQGVLEGVDAILGLHVDPERPGGEVGVRYGALTASCDEVAIVINGRGGHGARPHHAVDPIAAAVQLSSALYTGLPRVVDSRNPSVFSIGSIHAGSAPNVIPDTAEILGSLRTTAEGDNLVLRDRIEGIAAGVAALTETAIDVSFRCSLEAVRNDRQITVAVERGARSALGDSAVGRIEQPSMGGEDFSVYLQHVKGCMFRLGCRSPDGALLHTPGFDIDESALVPGARVMARAAVLLGQGLTR